MHKSTPLKILFLFLPALLISGCVPNNYRYDGTTSMENRDISEKERILLKTKNYQNLIAINHESLKKREDPDVRFRLAEYYYLAGNYNSSLHYLSVSLQRNPSTKVYLLQSKNLLAQQKYDSALKFVAMAIQKDRGNGEALNLQGIILAHQGKLAEARRSFETARNAFFTEEKVLNNLALVHIADREYTQAIQLLLPLYLRGNRDSNLVHNLVFAMVKSGDLRYAKEIIKRENLSRYPDTLVASLFEVESSMGPL